MKGIAKAILILAISILSISCVVSKSSLGIPVPAFWVTEQKMRELREILGPKYVEITEKSVIAFEYYTWQEDTYTLDYSPYYMRLSLMKKKTFTTPGYGREYWFFRDFNGDGTIDSIYREIIIVNKDGILIIPEYPADVNEIIHFPDKKTAEQELDRVLDFWLNKLRN